MQAARSFLAFSALMLLVSAAHAQNQRDVAVRNDKSTLADDSSWFYDDLDSAIEDAARTKHPLMVVFR
ncbi:MAG: hypothetical protein KDB27_31980 [Planctomycetales bacterium]|nr:hypothetical protein [Planctomycetales bacterium]